MPVTLAGGREIVPAELTVRQAMRLGKAIEGLRAELGVSRAHLAGGLVSPKGASQVLVKLLAGAVALVDLDAEAWPKATADFLREVGAIWGLSPDEVADLTLGDASELAAATWEANAQGPLGQRLGAMKAGITASFGPSLTTMVEAFTLRMTSALMGAPQLGGTVDGGTTPSSSPSPTPSDGETTPSEALGFDGPSNSLPASDTVLPSGLLSSASPTPGPEGSTDVGEATEALTPP